MIKYTLYLTKTQLDALKEYDGTVSEHVRRAIDRYINKKSAFSPSKK